VEHDRHTRALRAGSALAHTPAGARRRAAALREIRDAGESPITLLVLIGEVVTVVTPFAAFLIFLDFAVAHFAG
jgi:hypothetical protein